MREKRKLLPLSAGGAASVGLRRGNGAERGIAGSVGQPAPHGIRFRRDGGGADGRSAGADPCGAVYGPCRGGGGSEAGEKLGAAHRGAALYEAEGQEISPLAQTEDGAAAFYALAEEGSLLLRWDGSLAQFRWNDRTPRCISPQLWWTDADGDGEDELAVSCYAGSGTGVSV